MAPTYLNPALSGPLSNNIVPLHPITKEKLRIPDRVWESLKNWKSQIAFWDEESRCLQKMAHWKRSRTKSDHFKQVYRYFEILIDEELPQLMTAIQKTEHEIVSIMMDHTGDPKTIVSHFNKLEKQLTSFKHEMFETKLELLKEMARTPAIRIV